MVPDAETGLKRLNKIRLNGVTERNDAIKAMYDLLKSIKDGEVTSLKSGPDFKTFREHYIKVCGHSPWAVVRENSCLKFWERFFGADFKISKITARQILAYRGQLLKREPFPIGGE